MKKSKKEEQPQETPLMKQYNQVKAKHPDALVLFRVGDFYETFGEDAVRTSSILGIVLTKRNNGGSDVELAGFPHHSVDIYLPRLVKAGYRVAICDQLEKPSKDKKIVRRDVTEVVSPGLAVDDKLLDYKSNNYLASVYFSPSDKIGIAFLDISTGEFMIAEGEDNYVEKLISTFQPSEIIYPKGRKAQFERLIDTPPYTYTIEDWVYTIDFTRPLLLRHFEVQSLKGFGVEELELGQIAAGAVLQYLSISQATNISHILSIQRIQADSFVWLDKFTIRNLELVGSQHESGVPLVRIMDECVSPMGSRMLKKWILFPLTSIKAITGRHDMVELLLKDDELADQCYNHIKVIGDLERLISKAPLRKISPRELLYLGKSLLAVQNLKKVLSGSSNETLRTVEKNLYDCPELMQRIFASLTEDPPALLNKGNVIRNGVHTELDELRDIISNSKDYLLRIQQQEVQATGISSLKIGFNNVFGYYLEVTNKYKDFDKIPPTWIRKQTLANAERYITEELKELETKIFGAEERIAELEQEIFERLLVDVLSFIQPIQHTAHQIAHIDCLLSFARIARKRNYCRPEINDSKIIDIKEGRHPVIEFQLPKGETYVPNDVHIDPDDKQILMITGPNMSGKSAILRQTALICLMAQMGCFVPAAAATIGLVDKVFTRVGASDNLSLGESTFMVEMNETANILNNISDRSLILLDEIGRGTSTYDGISIAWSIAEFLHDNPVYKPKTLFATHYHELNELAERHPRIRNYYVATKELGQKVIFLRKLTPGGSQHSFGIHVAKMAGMPKVVVDRAKEILEHLEEKSIESNDKSSQKIKKKLEKLPQHYQLSIFNSSDPVATEIKNALLSLDLNGLTPIDCMMKLHELVKKLKE